MAEETTPATGVKISEGDWKSLNNRLDELDKINKKLNENLINQDKSLKEQAKNLPNVIQCVMKQYNNYDTTMVAIPLDDTIPQVSEGKTFMQVSIVPKDVKNILIIEAFAYGHLNTDGFYATMALFKDSNVNAICASHILAGTFFTSLSLKHQIIAETDKTINFKINMGVNTAIWTYTFNGASGARFGGNIPKAYIMVTEIRDVAMSVPT